MSKKTLGSIESEIRKTYGDICVSASSLAEKQGRVIPTTLNLDIALSGGIPEGSVVTIGGVEKSGKTTLCLEIAAKAQRLFKKKVYFVDVEGRLRTDLLKCIDGLIISEEEAEETGIPEMQIIRSVEGKFLTAEDFINIMTDILKEENVLVILDSIAALCPTATFSTQAGESKQMARTPQLMYDFMRRIAQVLPVMHSTLICITHLQSNIGGYGAARKDVGGNAQNFFGSVILQCLSSQEIDDPSTKKKIGKTSKFKVKHSALGPPGNEAIINIRYGHGCDEMEDLVDISEQLGFIDKAGAWFSFTNDKDEEVKLQGRNKLVNHLKENDEDAQFLISNVRKLVLD